MSGRSIKKLFLELGNRSNRGRVRVNLEKQMKKTIPYLLMLALVCLAYGNTLQHSFHFDDIPSILEKPWIRGLDKIPDFIFSFSQRPLVILSFNINYAVSGFEEWSYHAFNIIFHLFVEANNSRSTLTQNIR